MKDKIFGFFSSVKEFWLGASKKMRAGLLAGIAGILAVTLVIVLVLNHKEYVLLYSNLTSTEYGNVSRVLTEMGVETQTDGSGRISVLKQDEDQVRMRLAVENQPAAAFDYSEFDKASSLTATQFEKNQIQIHSLQDRISNIIMTMPEVDRAVVTISVPPGTAFALQKDNEPTSASVMVIAREGVKLSQRQIKGIVNLIKNSVHGLREENITITDQNGYLSTEDEQADTGDSDKLYLMEKVSEQIKREVLGVTQALYGTDGVRVAVNVSLDTNSKISEQITYIPHDPENPTNNPLDYSEFARDKDGDGFSAAQGVPGANDNIGTPQYPSMEQEAEGSTYYSGHDVYDYLVSSLKDQIVKRGLEITNASVAVVVNAKSLGDGERAALIDTVSKASGIPVENVSVQNFEFWQPPQRGGLIEGTASDMTSLLLIGGICLAAAIVILIMVLGFLSSRRKKREEEAERLRLIELEEAEQMQLEGLDYIEEEYEEDPMLVDLLAKPEEFEPIALIETQEQKLKSQIKDLADSDPEIVAQLLKTWLVASN